MQVNYPHEALLFKQTAHQLANFFIAFALNLAALVVFRVTPAWQTIFLPLVVIPLFLFSAGIGLVVSMISVVAMDVSKGIAIVLGLLMYLTPIIYSDNISNEVVQVAIKWNPLTYLICSCRDIVIYGRLYGCNGFLLSSIFSFLFFMISWRLFFVSEDKVVERLI